jgi:hypothetical protein
MVEVIEVKASHPARQHAEIEVGPLHRIDAHSVLAGIALLLAHKGCTHRGRRHHQHHELDRIECRRDLQPSIPATFQAPSVLPEPNACCLESLVKIQGLLLAVCARV